MDLPLEILSHILSFLDCEDWLSAVQVCRSWSWTSTKRERDTRKSAVLVRLLDGTLCTRLEWSCLQNRVTAVLGTCAHSVIAMLCKRFSRQIMHDEWFDLNDDAELGRLISRLGILTRKKDVAVLIAMYVWNPVLLDAWNVDAIILSHPVSSSFLNDLWRRICIRSFSSAFDLLYTLCSYTHTGGICIFRDGRRIRYMDHDVPFPRHLSTQPLMIELFALR
jgi:hypothetical protein